MRGHTDGHSGRRRAGDDQLPAAWAFPRSGQGEENGPGNGGRSEDCRVGTAWTPATYTVRGPAADGRPVLTDGPIADESGREIRAAAFDNPIPELPPASG